MSMQSCRESLAEDAKILAQALSIIDACNGRTPEPDRAVRTGEGFDVYWFASDPARYAYATIDEYNTEWTLIFQGVPAEYLGVIGLPEGIEAVYRHVGGAL